MTQPQYPDDEANPGGQHRFTAEEYAGLTPYQQGVISYMQAAWNNVISDDSPYPAGSRQHRAWLQGRQRAVIAVQDTEDE